MKSTPPQGSDVLMPLLAPVPSVPDTWSALDGSRVDRR